MKRLTIYTTVILTVFALNSCDQLLDIEADGTISGEVLTNAENIEQALTGAYYNLGGISNGVDGGELFGGDFMLIPTLLAHNDDNDISWDDANGPQYTDFIDKRVQAVNSRVLANWRRGYETINSVNAILANITNVGDQNRMNRIQGEALAIRGILYFEMARLWAPQYTETNPGSAAAIPLLTTPLDDVSQISSPDRASLAAVYAQAESDLMEAESLLASFDTNGTRLSTYACKAFLARLYLQQGEFARAGQKADEVIQSGAYALTASPLDAFNNVSNSTEDIFAIQQTVANNSGDVSTGTGITNFYSSINGSGLGVARILSFSLNTTVIRTSPMFAPNDVRGSIDTDVANDENGSNINAAFYRNLRNNTNDILSPGKFLLSNHVIPVMRLAEMYLIRAEAAFEDNPLVISDAAVADLNVIRTRAGTEAISSADLASPFALLDSLIMERRREFIYEGHLLHDSRRLDLEIGSSLSPLDANRASIVLPIPQAEEDAGG